MSDTVKLIIEMPEQAYELCKTLKSDSDDGIIGICAVNAIANGTPLDTVKSEIDKAQEPYITNTAYDEGVRFGLMLAYQIVDRYKAESEDKE